MKYKNSIMLCITHCAKNGRELEKSNEGISHSGFKYLPCRNPPRIINLTIDN